MLICPLGRGFAEQTPILEPPPRCTHNCFERWIECQRYAAKPMTPEEIAAHDRRLALAEAHRRR